MPKGEIPEGIGPLFIGDRSPTLGYSIFHVPLSDDVVSIPRFDPEAGIRESGLLTMGEVLRSLIHTTSLHVSKYRGQGSYVRFIDPEYPSLIEVDLARNRFEHHILAADACRLNLSNPENQGYIDPVVAAILVTTLGIHDIATPALGDGTMFLDRLLEFYDLYPRSGNAAYQQLNEELNVGHYLGRSDAISELIGKANALLEERFIKDTLPKFFFDENGELKDVKEIVEMIVRGDGGWLSEVLFMADKVTYVAQDMAAIAQAAENNGDTTRLNYAYQQLGSVRRRIALRESRPYFINPFDGLLVFQARADFFEHASRSEIHTAKDAWIAFVLLAADYSPDETELGCELRPSILRESYDSEVWDFINQKYGNKFASGKDLLIAFREWRPKKVYRFEFGQEEEMQRAIAALRRAGKLIFGPHISLPFATGADKLTKKDGELISLGEEFPEDFAEMERIAGDLSGYRFFEVPKNSKNKIDQIIIEAIKRVKKRFPQIAEYLGVN